MLTTKTFESKEDLLGFVNGGNVLRRDIELIEAVYGTKYRLWYWMTPPKPQKPPKPPKPEKPKGRPHKSKRGPAYPTKEKARACPYNEAILCSTDATCTGCGWKPMITDVLPEREPTLEEIAWREKDL